ncbi:Dimodular nonribosomal peptide synthase [Vibrio aerogenes CECT 7868]|uniref:Dimodular nonribosomal peptide synthase n=1 Tax=Vibrio aerogenes CECT 7868 TaxID=1216006 RepID=A0A1M5VVE9_9VIBR|nr:non-ribosomal peptide synthetase [Vibrio aerogenes]SHH79225.1 Dimodular nonribosomal peptide synthase [Vibrio aerogenes CECT 7868]
MHDYNRRLFPLSAAQRGIWFSQIMNPSARAEVYKITEYLEIFGEIQTDIFETSLRQAIREAESFNLVFEDTEDGPRQYIMPQKDWDFPVIDMRQEENPELSAEQWMRADMARPFKLNHGPLYSFALLRLKTDLFLFYASTHHLVMDGFGGFLFVRRVADIYSAMVNHSKIPECPFSTISEVFANDIEYQNSKQYRISQQYWQSQKENGSEPFSLSGENKVCSQVIRCQGTLSPQDNINLSWLTSVHHTSLPILLTSLAAIYIHRLADQNDLLFGFPMTARHNRLLRSFPGMVANVLPFHLKLNAAMTLTDVLLAVKQRIRSMARHQRYRPDDLNTSSWAEGREKGCSTIINIIPFPYDMHFGEFESAVHNLLFGPADDLVIHFCDYGPRRGIHIFMDANTNLYTESQLQMHLDRFIHFCSEILTEASDLCLSQYPLLLPEEQQNITLWNQTKAGYPANCSLYSLFAAQVRQSPDAIAVICGERQLTYGECEYKVNQLAGYLRSCGVEKGDAIVVCLERSAELILIQLAIVHCGAIYVPVDIHAPDERLNYVLSDCQARMIFISPDRQSAFIPGVKVVPFTLSIFTQLPAESTYPENLSGLDPAYIMYTSGSTGNPKGVLVPHRAVIRLVVQCGYADFNPQDNVAFAANPGFDAATMEVWAPLLNGGSVVVVEQNVLLDPLRLEESLLRHKVTVLWMTAGLFKQYAEVLGNTFQQLRYLIVGGDVLDPSMIQRVLENNAPRHLLNGYGPTETTTFALTYEIQPSAGIMQTIPLGRPINHTHVYILDSNHQPVPVGIVGEIYIGGDGVALGYMNRPDLTRERFLHDPFSEQSDARMYKSGDMGRWRSDGVIEFTGRNDEQIKIRGYRIEPAEIEQALQACQGVHYAVVIAENTPAQGKRLVAYYVPQAEIRVSAETLKTSLETQFPDYMVPAIYIELPCLPLTPNGKVDRKVLPKPDENAFIRDEYEVPQGETEQVLAGFWQDILHVHRIGRNDHFFTLGGHSLLAVQLISRIREQLNVELSLADMFAWPVLRQMASHIQQMQPSKVAGPEIPAYDGGYENSVFPLSFAQQRLWFLAQMDSEAAHAYIIAGCADLKGRLDVHVLKQALDQIVARHAILRTHFQVISGTPCQITGSAACGFPLQVIEIQEQTAEIEPFSPVFDLEKGPLIQGQLRCFPGHMYQLQLAMHHLIADGWSVSVFINELNILYSNLCHRHRKKTPLADLPFQYVDYARWQHENLQEDELKKQLSYWVEQLGGIPEYINLPADYPRPNIQDYSGKLLPVKLDHELTAGLRSFCKDQGCTMYMLLLAGWSVVMGRLARQNDIVIGSPVAGRTMTETESLIGMFVNTIALRIDLSDSPDTRTLLAQLKSTALSAMENKDIPFEQVVEAVSPARSSSHSPVFQVMFALQNVPPAQIDLPDVSLVSFEPLVNNAKFDLSLEMTEKGESLEGFINYASALFDERNIQEYLKYWQHLLWEMIHHPEQSVHTLPMLSPQASSDLLNRFSMGHRSAVSHLSVHEWFEQQVQHTPDAMAVIAGEEQLSYYQLNQRANQLAAYLQMQGAGPETRVALFCNRSTEFIIAMLSVLKAGGGYIPIDPACPAERLQFILSDCRPVFILTDREEGTEYLSGNSGVSVPVIHLIQDIDLWEHLPADNLRQDSSGPENLAYIIYTSGSTGRPKGVMVEHQNLAHLIHWHHQTFKPENGTYGSSVAGLGFDAVIWEIWPTLCAGACLLLPPVSASENPDQLLDWWYEQPLQTSFLPTPVAELALARGVTHPTLKTLLVGGDQLHSSPSDQHAFSLVNNYGPTETTVVATSGCISPESHLLHIGRPVTNTNIYILDESKQPVPVGVAGEIYIGGAGVSRGYLNRPELTAKHFLSDPFSHEPNARMYRTGDLGRWRADGVIEYLGRNDQQIKIRGYRIEPGEIMAAIQRCQGIQSAVVTAVGCQLNKRLVAYFTEHPHSHVSVEQLKKQLSEQLPDYMVPSAYIRLAHLPLTPNGKINYRELPQPDDRSFIRHRFEPPRGENEQILATIWKKLLGVDDISRHDNFFELGGHSLLAVQVIESLRQKGFHLAVKTLFSQPVLLSLAESLVPESACEDCDVPPDYILEKTEKITPDMLPLVHLTQSQIDRICDDIPGGAANVRDIYPLTPLQEGILYHHLVQQQGDLYVIRSIQSFPCLSRLRQYTQAIQALIDRHDVLRTSFVWEGVAEPVQVVWRQATLPVITLDIEAGDAESQLRQHLEPGQCKMNIRQAPMLEVWQVEDKENQCWLMCLRIHHLCTDHFSLELMGEEIHNYLQYPERQLRPSLPFRNFVARTRQKHDPDAEASFFRQQLGDIEHPSAPFGLMDIYGEGQQISRRHLSIDAALARRMREQAQLLGVSCASVFHLAWGLVIRASTGRDDIVFGTLLFGRMNAVKGADRMMGLCLNTLPFRLSLDHASVRDCVLETHQKLAQLLEFEHTPLTRAQQYSRVASPLPLFSSLLNYRYQQDFIWLRQSEESLKPEILFCEERSTYPVSLSVNDFPGGEFSLDIQSDIRVSCEQLGLMMMNALSGVLTALETTPEYPVNRLNVLPEHDDLENGVLPEAVIQPIRFQQNKRLNQGYVPPKNSTEKILAKLWQTLLNIERIGRNDDFFELGGHSLLAIRLIHEARAQGIEFSLSTLLNASVLKDLAKKVSLSATE